MATAWLCKYVLAEDRKSYEAKGWKVAGRGPCLGGWRSYIMEKRARKEKPRNGERE